MINALKFYNGLTLMNEYNFLWLHMENVMAVLPTVIQFPTRSPQIHLIDTKAWKILWWFLSD